MTDKYGKTVERALNILAYSPNTEKQLVRKLREKGAAEEDISAAVAYLKKKGYLDEEEYLRRFVALQGKTYGRRRVYAAACAKGFSDEVLNRCFDEACADVDFSAACLKQIRAKCRGGKLFAEDDGNGGGDSDDGDGAGGRRRPDREALRKLTASLMRAGFDIDTIREALREYLA